MRMRASALGAPLISESIDEPTWMRKSRVVLLRADVRMGVHRIKSSTPLRLRRRHDAVDAPDAAERWWRQRWRGRCEGAGQGRRGHDQAGAADADQAVADRGRW